MLAEAIVEAAVRPRNQRVVGLKSKLAVRDSGESCGAARRRAEVPGRSPCVWAHSARVCSTPISRPAAVAFFSEVFERFQEEAADAYAVGLCIDFEGDDARRPVVTAGFNSQAGIDAALGRWPGLLRMRRTPADEEEARWDFAFWSHNDLARFGEPEEDRDGAATLERWIRLNGWWYTDEEERDADLLLHGPVYDSTLAAAAREANPVALVDDFAAWAERQDLGSTGDEPDFRRLEGADG